MRVRAAILLEVRLDVPIRADINMMAEMIAQATPNPAARGNLAFFAVSHAHRGIQIAGKFHCMIALATASLHSKIAVDAKELRG